MFYITDIDAKTSCLMIIFIIISETFFYCYKKKVAKKFAPRLTDNVNYMMALRDCTFVQI